MAVYFDHAIQCPIPGCVHTGIAWHSNYALLAVSSKQDSGVGGIVNLYLDEGEIVEDSGIQRTSDVTCMSWHPSRKILAMGWANGEVMMWNEHDHKLHEADSIHKGSVTLIQWNSTGNRLISADENGLLVAWKIDQRGRPSNAPMYQIDKKGTTITCCAFKPLPSQDSYGGQNSLDVDVWKKGSRPVPGLEYCFYFGCNDGNVCYVDDKGKSMTAFTTEGPVRTILYHGGSSAIVTITEGLICAQHQQGHDGVYQELMKVKLSGQPTKAQTIWAGRGILATASGENVIRMWDLQLDENFVLMLDKNGIFEAGESINCLSYNKSKGILAAGTNGGKVAMWKYVIPKDVSNIEGQQKWEPQPTSVVGGDLKTIQWGGNKNLLAVSNEETVVILNEQVMNSHFNDQVIAVQVSPSQLAIQNVKDGSQHDLKTDIHIKGVFVTKDHTTIWNGKKVVVYEVSSDKALVRAEGNFNSDSMTIVVHEQNVYTIEPGKIQVRTFQGTIKQVLAFTETEGDPVLISICGNYLVAATSLGLMKLWDLSRREAKPQCNPKSFQESFPSAGRIKSIKCNCTGTKISIICDKSNNTPDSKLYVWDVDADSFQAFDFAKGESVQKDEDQVMDDPSLRAQQGSDIRGRYPVSQYWDSQEPRLLVCQAQYSASLDTEQNNDKQTEKSYGAFDKEETTDAPDVMMVSLFSTPENGVLLQDYFAMESGHSCLIGVDVPFFYFIKKGGDTEESSATAGAQTKQKFAQKTMRDFLGLENADKDTKTAMMNFSYLSVIGNMDEAFKAIKLIKSESVWENMARMCVKTKRLDVASVCLGNMANARAAHALRDACKESELNAKVALLAIQLGMTDEAEKLLKSCKRYDLLNQFYQASNKWIKAIETAEVHDRIHLRTTYYNYAKHLESDGNVQAAITNFEKSDTHRFEVPRMLLDNPSHLESYIMKTKDKELRRWWAQYMESAGEMESALQFYEAAKDQLSLVRVYCYCGNLDKAAEICNDTGDRAASYHLARQYENQDNVKGAIHMYTRSQCYSNAIRLAKEHGLENDLMNLALLSTPEDMIDVAKYYESLPNMQDKAVMLYHKGGQIGKALELCFRTQQFSALQVIAEDLDENTDPEMLNKCAEFFLEHQQYDRAVELLIIGKKYNEALELCVSHNVLMTEDLAEKMTLPKEADKQDLRNNLLEKIGEVCMVQQQYHLATKKYTQAGNKIKAMKALLKSGDTEKIVFFAGVSRQREIYVMAANYLQSLDWRKDPDIMKNIISFYTKGRALDSLAGFYDACAQVEIDEYQNYDKALGALTEAYKCISKAKMKNVAAQEEKAAFLKQRIGLVKKFVQARRLLEEDPDECMKQCEVLLEEPDLETAVRVGDVYGIMIEHYARKENYNKAYNLMQEMRQRIPGVNMAYYVNMRTIETVHKALDIPLGRGMGAEHISNGLQDEDEGEEVEEEVEEEYD